MRAAKTSTEIRQEQIAEAAMALICEGGMSGLSMGAIAERIGVVPSALYRHYPGKEAVLDAVMALLRERLRANVTAVCSRTGDSLERLRCLLLLHMQMLSENRAFPHVVFAHLSQSVSEDQAALVRSTMCAYLDDVEGIIAAGQECGEISSPVSARTLAVMFVGLVLPAAMLYRLSEGDFDPLAHAHAVWPVYLAGLRSAEGVSGAFAVPLGGLPGAGASGISGGAARGVRRSVPRDPVGLGRAISKEV